MKKYGITHSKIVTNDIEMHIENIDIKGYSIQENVLSQEECKQFIEKLEQIYTQQCETIGVSNLERINELNLVRMPFLYDKSFNNLFLLQQITDVIEAILGKNYILHLQNAILNRSKSEHHQGSWHRDLPYQDWVISKPIACNAFICLTDFTSDNGATEVLPFTHKIDYFPSTIYAESNAQKLTATAGSIIYFDSMLFHRAGINKSNNDRIGINHVFVSPILKQQIDFTEQYPYINELSDAEKRILGFTFKTPKSVDEFRKRRLDK